MNQDKDVPTYVTNKWLIGMLVALVMTMGGYIFNDIGKGSDAQAAVLSELQRRVNDAEILIAEDNARNAAQYREILRRLERIENSLDRAAGRPTRLERESPPPTERLTTRIPRRGDTE